MAYLSFILTSVNSFIEDYRFLGIKLLNGEDLAELVLRFLLNTVVISVLVVGLYAKNSKRKDFYFSYYAVSIVVFLLCILLENVKLELGFALGLFAIFGIIRYRTDAIPIKEMTYLFVVIAVSVINALANKKVSYAELISTNLFVIGTLWALEKVLMLRQEISQQIIYEKIENIHADRQNELLEDLKARTGINIKRAEIVKIDFLRDICLINIYYDVNGSKKKQ
jgi:hypothetical protein